MESFAGGQYRGLQTLEVPHDNRFQTLQVYPQHDEQQSNGYTMSNMAPTGAQSSMGAFNDSQAQFPIIIEEHRAEATESHDMDHYLQNPPGDEPSKTETSVYEDIDNGS